MPWAAPVSTLGGRRCFRAYGVTYYTGKDAVRKTLQSIAERTAPGSSVMFDYLADSESTPRAFRDLRKRGADFVARRGEPWISSFDPAGIPDFLVGVGYSEIVNLKPDEIGSKYFSRHPDLIHPPFIGLCHATTSARLILAAPVYQYTDAAASHNLNVPDSNPAPQPSTTP